MNIKKIGDQERGMATVLYGSPNCLAGDTQIKYCIKTRTGKVQNRKGGTLEHLHERFNGISVPGKGFYPREATTQSDYYVQSIDKYNKVFLNKVYAVVKTGKKVVYKLETASSKSILATKEHFFYVGDKYVPLKELKAGDEVFIHDNSFKSQKKEKRKNYAEVTVKFHPNWCKRVIAEKGKLYTYYRGSKSRAVYEAFLNNLSLKDYLETLNTGTEETIRKLRFLHPYSLVHHIDGNINNNVISNLMVVSRKKHTLMHLDLHKEKLAYYVHSDKIVSIKRIGKVETYDIKMYSPYNNFIANGIVVHNSGKTYQMGYFPKDETIILDVDGGILTLAGTEISVFPIKEDLSEIAKIYNYLKTEKHPFKYVCIDNFSELEKFFLSAIGKERNVEYWRQLEWGNASQKDREYMRRFRDLTELGINVIFIAWDMQVETDDGVKTSPMLMRKVAGEFAGLMDNVWYLKPDSEINSKDRFMVTESTQSVTAKTRVPFGKESPLAKVIKNPNVFECMNKLKPYYGKDKKDAKA